MAFIVSIWAYVSEGFQFYLPVFVANVSIYIVFSFIGLDIPLDQYKKINGKRLVGHGRSMSGAFFYILTAIFIAIIQQRALEGLYLGVGGIFGTHLNSFIKRRLNIKQGDYFFFLDQTDFILGGSLFYMTAFHLELKTFFAGVLLALVLHHLVNLLRKPWEKSVKHFT